VHTLSSNLVRMNREMDRNAVVHDQMRKDHQRQLEDHVRSMEGRSPEGTGLLPARAYSSFRKI
jgi:hypothetical protein